MSDIEQKNKGENILFNDVCGIIDDARRRVAVYVNSEICQTKWYVGKRIKEDVIKQEHAQLKVDNTLNPDIVFRSSYFLDMLGLPEVFSERDLESPIGMILCSEGNTEHIEYLMLDENSPIKVTQYYTQLPDKKLLAEKLQRAIAIAREHFVEQKHNA